MRVADPDHIKSVASAIQRYLAHCPDASETAEGVARWWLARQRYNDALELVQNALDTLEEDGQVERVNTGAGSVLYRKSHSVN